MTIEAQEVDVGRRPLADHAAVVGDEEIERLRALAGPLEGLRVLHVTAAEPGGRAPNQLRSLVPLLRDLGLGADWRVLVGDEAFDAVGWALDEGLRGAETAIDEASWHGYLAACERAASELPGADVVVVHDPAPAAVVRATQGPTWAWRLHLDAARPDPPAWERLAPFVEAYTAVVAPRDDAAPPDVEATASAPAIDPLAPRNHELPLAMAGSVLRSVGLDLKRPLCCQVARLDRWQDPQAVIDAFRRARQDAPGLQLVLAGALAGEGPDDWAVVGEIADYAAAEEDLHLVTSFQGVGALELNALQRISRVAVQWSLRGGFDRAVQESLWKGTPVIAPAGRRAPLGLGHDRHGHLAETPDEAGARLAELVRDPALAIELGQRGREDVRERFLVTRLVADELRLAGELSGSRVEG